jgi:dUTP pyrophosphatase
MIGTKELLRLVKENRLVEGLCDRELNEPEGSGFDLRAGEFFKLEGNAFLGIKDRKTPSSVSLVKYNSEIDSTFDLMPGQYVLVKTIEKVNIPKDIVALVRPRTTNFRSGVSLHSGPIHPGYCGELTFGLKNETNDIIVSYEMGSRIAHILFDYLAGDIISAYRGQWQGGRVSTLGETEKQV